MKDFVLNCPVDESCFISDDRQDQMYKTLSGVTAGLLLSATTLFFVLFFSKDVSMHLKLMSQTCALSFFPL